MPLTPRFLRRATAGVQLLVVYPLQPALGCLVLAALPPAVSRAWFASGKSPLTAAALRCALQGLQPALAKGMLSALVAALRRVYLDGGPTR